MHQLIQSNPSHYRGGFGQTHRGPPLSLLKLTGQTSR